MMCEDIAGADACGCHGGVWYVYMQSHIQTTFNQLSIDSHTTPPPRCPSIWVSSPWSSSSGIKQRTTTPHSRPSHTRTCRRVGRGGNGGMSKYYIILVNIVVIILGIVCWAGVVYGGK